MDLNRPYIIDIEASSLSSHSYPIEVGLALDDGERICFLIKPEKDWTEWDKAAEDVHHITQKVLRVCGKPVTEVAKILNKRLEGKTLYSDGWVVDKPWISKLFYAAGIDMAFEVSPIERILSEKQMNIWHNTKDRVLMESQLTRHRASNDAWVIQETYRITANL